MNSRDFWALLARIVVRKAAAKARKVKRQGYSEPLQEEPRSREPTPEEMACADELFNRLNEFVSGINDEMRREAARLAFFEELSAGQVRVRLEMEQTQGKISERSKVPGTRAIQTWLRSVREAIAIKLADEYGVARGFLAEVRGQDADGKEHVADAPNADVATGDETDNPDLGEDL
jgi:hypothetical protein